MKSETDWNKNKVMIELNDDEEEFTELEELIAQVKSTVIGLGYSPDSVEKFIPEE